MPSRFVLTNLYLNITDIIIYQPISCLRHSKRGPKVILRLVVMSSCSVHVVIVCRIIIIQPCEATPTSCWSELRLKAKEVCRQRYLESTSLLPLTEPINDKRIKGKRESLCVLHREEGWKWKGGEKIYIVQQDCTYCSIQRLPVTNLDRHQYCFYSIQLVVRMLTRCLLGWSA